MSGNGATGRHTIVVPSYARYWFHPLWRASGTRGIRDATDTLVVVAFMSSSDTITSVLSSATRRRPLSRGPAHAFDRLDVHSPVRKFSKECRAVALGGTGSCVSRTLVGGDMRNTRRRFLPIIVSAVL